MRSGRKSSRYNEIDARTARWSCLAVATAWTAFGGLAPSVMADPDDFGGACSFSATPASFEALPGGVTRIAALVAPTECTGKAAPTFSTICISTPVSPKDTCGYATGWDPARAVLQQPSPAGSVKVTTNTCWQVVTTYARTCTGDAWDEGSG
jgi:hypothetical protein